MGEAIAQLKKLRSCFERAKTRLEALPETGLSEAGQPYIQEAADALQSFAAWFGTLTFDRYSILGSARRVHVAIAAVDAIVDWIGLHRSQQFADDISEQMAELVRQSQSLDDAVMEAFLVESSPDQKVYRTSAFVPQEKRDAVEDGIEAVASLAGHLGIRLQRIALMTGSTSVTPVSTKQQKRRDRKGIGGRPERYTLKFIREVVAARERDQKHAAKARHPLPTFPQWLSDYCSGKGIDIGKMFPPKTPGEAWSKRANNFWRAAKKRLREAETNRH